MRKTFEYDGTVFRQAAVIFSYDEDTEIYVNGQKLLSVSEFITNYRMPLVTEQLKKALKKGHNTLAVHTHQTIGGQFIDVGLLICE